MTRESCCEKGRELLEKANQKQNARIAFCTSYYFFWAGDFESAKKALETAYALKKEDYLPSDYGRVSGLMDIRTRSKLVHAFAMGLEEMLRMQEGSERAGQIESCLRRGGFWDDETRKVVLEYMEFDALAFLMAHSLSPEL